MKVIFFYNLGIFSQILEKHLIFALGIGADIRPQNRPRKIPGVLNHKTQPSGFSGLTRTVILFGHFYHLIWESFPIQKWPLFSQFHVF